MTKTLYATTADGNLIVRKTGQIIRVITFEVIKGKRGEVIQIAKESGGQKNVRRSQVDEAAYSFGPPADGTSPAASQEPKRAGAPPPPPPPAKSSGRVISLTREEAMDLLQVARGLADTLADKLINETVGK